MEGLLFGFRAEGLGLRGGFTVVLGLGFWTACPGPLI